MRQIAPTVYKLRKTIKNLLQPDAHYLLAVSGGADSLALAHACAALAAQAWGSYSVCHVEHGLRGEEALRDMQAVQCACKAWGLPCFTEHVQAASYAAQNRLSTEDAARRLRYAALRRIAAQQGAVAIVTAHHEGDQAETLLLRLLRGAGLQGLAGMRAQQGDIIRPLLTLPKSLLEEYCSVEGIAVCYDSTNADTAYTRNRVRLELVPYLERSFNHNVVPTLARTAALLAQDAECLEQMADAAYRQLVRRQEDAVSFPVTQLTALHSAVRLRVLRRAYFELGGEELSFERSQAIDSLLLRRSGGKIIQLPQGINVVYKNKQLIFVKII